MRQIPLLYFGLTLLMGIITDAVFNINPVTAIGGLVLLWCGYLSIIIENKSISSNQPSLKTFLIFLIVFITGVASNGLRSSLIKPCPDPKGEMLLVKLEVASGNRGDRKTFLASIRSWEGNQWSKKLAAYIFVDTARELKEGTFLLTKNNINRIKSTSNPGEFDFSRYAALNDVHHTMQIRKESGFILVQSPESEKPKFFLYLRDLMTSIIQKHFEKKEEAGLAEAILLGYKKNLDQDLIHNYIDTGVIHVIAISGMHLGLIFGLVDLLIKLTVGKKRSRWLAVVISLPLLWTFALLTGASASVMRSAIMFSFMIIGNAIGRRNHALNGLAGAALILILNDPDAWMDLGFQLSFAAVLSIMFFNKKISSWLFFRNPILKLIWNLVAVTLAAQILTTPLVIYHFHRFPTLFLFTNMVAVPLSSIILLLEIFLCILNPFTFLSTPIEGLISICMHAMNGYINMMAKVPFGMIDDIYLSLGIISMVALLGICIWQLSIHPSKWIWRILILLNLSIGCTHLLEKIKISATKYIQVLNFKNGTVLLHQHGKTGEIWASEMLIQDQSVIIRIAGIFRNNGVRSIKWRKIPETPLLISDRRNFTLFHKVSLTPGLEISEINDEKSLWITDGSISMWKSREWKKASQKLHLRFHSTLDEGPFTIGCSHSSQKR